MQHKIKVKPTISYNPQSQYRDGCRGCDIVAEQAASFYHGVKEKEEEEYRNKNKEKKIINVNAFKM